MRESARNVLKHAALVVLGLAVGIGCLELALRATGWVFLHLRQPALTASAKARNHEYRVLCLGESTTADITFFPHDTYPIQLQRILNRTFSGRRFTVINGGIPATMTDGIVAQLPWYLARYRPDIVVTMMGINDGESVDPVLQVGEQLRVWKLIKMLYYRWRNPFALTRASVGGPPDMVLLSGEIAWRHVIAGRYQEAEELLLPMLQRDEWTIAKSRAHGMMAVLSWQRGNGEEGERYHQRFVELERNVPRPKTIQNYRELREALREHGIPLVAVQYPGLPVDMLKQIIGPAPDVVFVDNEQTFLQATKERPVRDLYRDLFGGIFGHMTPLGNGLLARNVAHGVRKVMAAHPDHQP